MDEMMKMIFKHHFVHERRCWWCKWRQSKQSAKIPPLVRARHAGKDNSGGGILPQLSPFSFYGVL